MAQAGYDLLAFGVELVLQLMRVCSSDWSQLVTFIFFSVVRRVSLFGGFWFGVLV